MSDELGELLRSRRARIKPEDVGFKAGRGRRVEGLRREEVAALASVSVDYIKRLEAGRIRPSDAVLDSLARALMLDVVERAHLFALAGRAGAATDHALEMFARDCSGCSLPSSPFRRSSWGPGSTCSRGTPPHRRCSAASSVAHPKS